MMIAQGEEPLIRAGLVSGPELNIELAGQFVSGDGSAVPPGKYAARRTERGIKLEGPVEVLSRSEPFGIRLAPVDFETGRFIVHGVTIGIDFHWERRESQTFQGSLVIRLEGAGLRAINELPVEAYIVTVIASEMSVSGPAELLKAHAVISRSWLLAQLEAKKRLVNKVAAEGTGQRVAGSPDEIIRWYTREAHSDFDVCSDDHCQRYQGVGKAFSPAASEAVNATGGLVLISGEEICDARYSKCCGGITERYSAAWDDRDIPYLSSLYDGRNAADIGAYAFPLSIESNADRWIASDPPAFCNVGSTSVLSRILPGFDQETADFYRWQVTYGAPELGEIVRDRLGIDVGDVRDLTALERGDSGRIIRLRITGSKRTVVVGKELEVRRALSRSHLYSSAFVVRREQGGEGFKLIGAGWGHGVGLCQIGAAMMAEAGYSYEQILSHYFSGSTLKTAY